LQNTQGEKNSFIIRHFERTLFYGKKISTL